jgi:histidinol-phosphate aminotransferase
MLAHWRDIPGLFVLRSLSKIGFAGLRLGALVAPREVIAELDKVRLPWNVNAVSMAIACAALAHPALLDARIQSVVELRRQLETALHAIPGLIVYPSAANFVLVRLPTDARAAARHLLEADVLVKDVSAPGLLERCLRITVGTVAENGRCACALREHLASAV